MLKAVIDHFGHIDIVVNSAGQSLSSKITDYNVEQWDTMIDVNIKGTLHATLPYLLKQSSGHIINLASVSDLNQQRRTPFMVRQKQQYMQSHSLLKRN